MTTATEPSGDVLWADMSESDDERPGNADTRQLIHRQKLQKPAPPPPETRPGQHSHHRGGDRDRRRAGGDRDRGDRDRDHGRGQQSRNFNRPRITGSRPQTSVSGTFQRRRPSSAEAKQPPKPAPKLQLSIISSITAHANETEGRNTSIFGEGKPREDVLKSKVTDISNPKPAEPKTPAEYKAPSEPRAPAEPPRVPAEPQAPAESRAFAEPRVPAERAYGEPRAPAERAYGEPRAPAERAYGEPRAPAERPYGEPRAPAEPRVIAEPKAEPKVPAPASARGTPPEERKQPKPVECAPPKVVAAVAPPTGIVKSRPSSSFNNDLFVPPPPAEHAYYQPVCQFPRPAFRFDRRPPPPAGAEYAYVETPATAPDGHYRPFYQNYAVMWPYAQQEYMAELPPPDVVTFSRNKAVVSRPLQPPPPPPPSAGGGKKPSWAAVASSNKST